MSSPGARCCTTCWRVRPLLRTCPRGRIFLFRFAAGHSASSPRRRPTSPRSSTAPSRGTARIGTRPCARQGRRWRRCLAAARADRPRLDARPFQPLRRGRKSSEPGARGGASPCARVGDALLAEAEEHSSGVRWKRRFEFNDDVEYSPDIYGGTAGVALFLAELGTRLGRNATPPARERRRDGSAGLFGAGDARNMACTAAKRVWRISSLA